MYSITIKQLNVDKKLLGNRAIKGSWVKKTNMIKE